jgi:hypothetical protein
MRRYWTHTVVDVRLSARFASGVAPKTPDEMDPLPTMSPAVTVTV